MDPTHCLIRKKSGDEGGFGHSAFRRVVSPRQNKLRAGEKYGFAEYRDGRWWSSINCVFFFLICVLCVNGANHLVLAIIRLTL